MLVNPFTQQVLNENDRGCNQYSGRNCSTRSSISKAKREASQASFRAMYAPHSTVFAHEDEDDQLLADLSGYSYTPPEESSINRDAQDMIADAKGAKRLPRNPRRGRLLGPPSKRPNISGAGLDRTSIADAHLNKALALLKSRTSEDELANYELSPTAKYTREEAVAAIKRDNEHATEGARLHSEARDKNLKVHLIR